MKYSKNRDLNKHFFGNSYSPCVCLCLCLPQSGVPEQEAIHQQTHQGVLLSIQHQLSLTTTHLTPALSSCDYVLIKSIDCYSQTQCELNPEWSILAAKWHKCINFIGWWQKRDPFFNTDCSTYFIFSHISSYSGRFMMQLQLYWPHLWSTQLPSFTHDTYRYHQSHCANCAPHTPQRGTSTPQQWQSLPSPFSSSLPSIIFSHLSPRTQALLFKICLLVLSSEVASRCEPIHFFIRFLSFNYKKWGENSSGKAKASAFSFPLDTWKAKSEWQSSEYLCVYTHSSFKANICPEHWQTQMFSSR